MVKPIFFITFIFYSLSVYSQQEIEIVMVPQPYEKALKNPLMGFTTTNLGDHPWASVTHTYIRWNELENNESDGIDKIVNVSNQKWKNAASKNMKVIPRVYLHWDGDKKYWPSDMQTDDYTSAQFQKRILRLIKRLGACWDNDPRVAFVEMGIIGKWGEHHSPSPSVAQQKLLGDAFSKAFKNKKVSVRHFWSTFTNYQFGEYWDSWAHYDQMWGHGNSIKQINEKTGRYKDNYIGGEVAYNWGAWEIQPGATPTQSVAIQKHRDFVVNSIRWLHCTQLRWITGYDKYNTEAVKGAEEIQKAFGYRYVLDEVRFSLSDSLKIAFDVTNTGSAPFYYNWPIEVALLDSVTKKPVLKAKMDQVDIRKWLPGEGWTDPQWTYVGAWQEYLPDVNWNPSKTSEWAVPPAKNKVEGKFKIEAPNGTYILSLSINDPAGNLPSVRLATGNYLNGGRHPIGLIAVGDKKCYPLPANFKFDDPNNDHSLYYDDKFEIVYDRDPEQTPFGGKPKVFPTDTVLAWQYDFMTNKSGNKYFSLDSANTVGIYGCNDTSGFNVRLYQDSVQHKDAAQFSWDQTTGTFQKNGQWLEYSVDFKLNQPYQLVLRARNNVDANFKVTIFNTQGNVSFFKDYNLKNDFKNTSGGNDQTAWFLSNSAIPGLWGSYIVRFDWYDHVGEPGVFGAFSMVASQLDVTPPKWYYISLGTFSPGTDIVAMTTEDATIFMVPQGTAPDTTAIKEAAVSVTRATAYKQATLLTSNVTPGSYVLYAIDASGNISAASSAIKLEYPVSASLKTYESDIKVFYYPGDQLIRVKSNKELRKIVVFSILGQKVGSVNCNGTEVGFQSIQLVPGVYLVHVFEKEGKLTAKKIVVQ